MQRKITTIRNLGIVEKELSSKEFGVISLSINKENYFTQFATNFIYQDKNIYLFIDDKELIRSLKIDSLARFTVFKNKSNSSSDKVNLYNLFSITVTGLLKEVEEKKTLKDITQSFIQKYSGKLMITDKAAELKGKLYFIDSEELIAFDEIGF